MQALFTGELEGVLARWVVPACDLPCIFRLRAVCRAARDALGQDTVFHDVFHAHYPDAAHSGILPQVPLQCPSWQAAVEDLHSLRELHTPRASMPLPALMTHAAAPSLVSDFAIEGAWYRFIAALPSTLVYTPDAKQACLAWQGPSHGAAHIGPHSSALLPGRLPTVVLVAWRDMQVYVGTFARVPRHAAADVGAADCIPPHVFHLRALSCARAPPPRSGFRLIALDAERVLLVAGSSPGDRDGLLLLHSDVWQLHLPSMTWERVRGAPHGGEPFDEYASDSEEAEEVVEAAAVTGPSGRRLPAVALSPDSRYLLMFGGEAGQTSTNHFRDPWLHRLCLRTWRWQQRITWRVRAEGFGGRDFALTKLVPVEGVMLTGEAVTRVRALAPKPRTAAALLPLDRHRTLMYGGCSLRFPFDALPAGYCHLFDSRGGGGIGCWSRAIGLPGRDAATIAVLRMQPGRWFVTHLCHAELYSVFRPT